MNFMDIIKGRRILESTNRMNRSRYPKGPGGRAGWLPSASNLQPLRYLIVDDPALLDKVFVNLSWAGYISRKEIEKSRGIYSDSCCRKKPVHQS